MINEQLLRYIKQQLQLGKSSTDISSALTIQGWKQEQIQETFGSLTPQAPPPPKKSKKKRIIVGCAVTFVIIIVLLVILTFLLPVLLNLFYKDIPSVNDDDLVLSQVAVPKDQNAFYDIVQIKTAMYDASKILDDYNTSHSWSDTLVQDALSKNDKAFALVDSSLSKPKFQNPVFADPSNATLSEWTDPSQKTDPFATLKMARNTVLKSLYLSRQGKDTDAMAATITNVQLGQKISEFQPQLDEYLVGLALKGIGFASSRALLTSSKLTSDFLIGEIKNFEVYKNNTSGIVNALKGDYLFFKTSIDAVVNGDPAAYASVPGATEATISSIKGRIKNSYLIQPNRTKNILAEFFRTGISDVQSSCSMIKDIRANQPPKFKPSPFMIFTQNALGLSLTSGLTNSLDMSFFLERKCNDLLDVTVTQTMFAIKAYKTDTSAYPTTLSVLVPKYIRSVPEDPYNGSPLQYNASKKILYSVGVGGSDAGGSTGNDWTKMANPTFQINF